MNAVKIIYQRKSTDFCYESRKRGTRTQSPNGIMDKSSKLFRIQVNTPSFYRTGQCQFLQTSVNSPIVFANPRSKLKSKRESYKPSSSLYKKLNVRLTLNTLEFRQCIQPGLRLNTRSRLRKTIDLTSSNPVCKNLTPLEARGSSINSSSYQ